MRQEEASPVDLRFLIRAFVKYAASDMHLKPGRPPLYRINGKLVAANMDVLDHAAIKKMILGILSDARKKELEEKHQTDFSFRIDEIGRFRCNIFYQRGQLAAAIRMIPLDIPEIAPLQLPEVVKEICMKPRGLVMITGPTGSGKSTTLAAMIQYINHHSYVHVLCLEDPIEFIFRDEKATITQREIGSDTNSFEEALYAGLRQDPDVIVVGELRDAATIQMALTAAETGHLVLATLHTRDAKGSIERIIDVFPQDAKNQIRLQLASVLTAVVSQHLVLKSNGDDQVPTCEILINSPMIQSAILKNEIGNIPEIMAKSSEFYKMQTFNQDLERMIHAGVITLDEALHVSPAPEDLRLRISGIVREGGYDIKAG